MGSTFVYISSYITSYSLLRLGYTWGCSGGCSGPDLVYPFDQTERPGPGDSLCPAVDT